MVNPLIGVKGGNCCKRGIGNKRGIWKRGKGKGTGVIGEENNRDNILSTLLITNPFFVTI
jgi:hypothetical protein